MAEPRQPRLEGNVLVTGGAGFLGRAILRRAEREGWPARFTVYSRDEAKQWELRRRYPEVRCVLGDVASNDMPRLMAAMAGQDLVVHAAAVKFIPEAEQNVLETIDVNVNGSRNVAMAAIAADVKTVVGISTDKACVDWFGPVEFADGSTRKISKIVKHREAAVVKTIGPAGLGEARVVGWHKNKRAERPMVGLTYEDSYFRRRSRAHVWVTSDHPVLTPDGWMSAGSLRSGDAVVTGEPAPNERQTALLVGMLLGDASLDFRGALTVGHAADQEQWLDTKASGLKGLVTSAKSVLKGTGVGRQDFFVRRSRAWTSLLQMRHAFYPDGRKNVPRKIVERYFSPELLAAWYGDDGCLDHSKGNNLARFSTHGFVEGDVRWLADLLTLRGFPAYVSQDRVDGRCYYGLRLRADGSRRLFEAIGCFLPPALRHKLPEWADPYDPSKWELGSAIPFVGRAVIRQGERPPRDVYCLDVETTHNFVVAGIVLHNCGPLNVYGMTKAIMERLFAEANRMGRTRFVTVRYGNVVGSTGSVIPVFKRQIEDYGEIRVTDERMTRFWLGVDEAVDLITLAAARAETFPGHTIIDPCPAMKIVELAAAVWRMEDVDLSLERPNFNPSGPIQYRQRWDTEGKEPIRFTGIRPGEKLHESLFNDQEAPRVRREGRYFVMAPATVAALNEGRQAYSSDAPVRWLGLDEMVGLIRDAEDV